MSRRHRDFTRKTMMSVYSGSCIDYADPHIDDILISDVIHGMGFICRFGGQCKTFYSVAEHAAFTHDIVKKGLGINDRDILTAALFHDGHEAYLGDMPSPLKALLGGKDYRALVNKFDELIAERLGIDPELFHHPAVEEADYWVLNVEGAKLRPHSDYPWEHREIPEGVRWACGLTSSRARRAVRERARKAPVPVA